MSDAIKVYGLRISYYTGKMEAYLRFKEIPHDFVVLTPKLMTMVEEKTGASQMPAIELPDGRFMTDTTPMIDWFETQYPEPAVIPEDPALAFYSRLIEDYAEDWLWRPAMHYRWSYRADRMHLSRKIVDELMADVPLPGAVMRAWIRYRQRHFYVRRDGVNSGTWDHVESIYLNTLDRLNAIFLQRPYLLGDRPTLADFGFFAPMFRHFAQDPTASDIMRARSPAVFEWQARLWNARASRVSGPLVAALPEDTYPLLEDIGGAYLPYLNDNARAWQAQQTHFDPVVGGVRYRKVPVSQYRVWCLERLQHHLLALPEDRRPEVESLLADRGCLQPLTAIDNPESRYDEEGSAPFRGRKVHYHNRRD